MEPFKMLSGKELMDLRTSKAHPKTLPSMPPKEFVPTHSAEETASIEKLLNEKLSFLKEGRAEKKSLLSTAEWLPGQRMAKVTGRFGGGWDTFGIEKSGATHLHPEEALFLIELSKLELWFGGCPVSVQQAYEILLKEDVCPVMHYRVFSHLCRLGYKVVKRSEQSIKSKRSSTPDQASSSKRLKLDDTESSAMCGESLLNTSFCTPNLLFQEPAGQPSDFDCIPHFGGGIQNVQIHFPDQSLLPESIRNRQSSYKIEAKRFLRQMPEEKIENKPTSRTKTWAEFENPVLQPNLPRENHPLYSGSMKPIVNGNVSGDVYARWQLLGPKPADSSDEDDDDADLKICYDVYSPDRHFRKSDPGIPCYVLGVVNWESSFPGPFSLRRLRNACTQQSLPLIAVAGEGSDVSYYQIKKTVSPL